MTQPNPLKLASSNRRFAPIFIAIGVSLLMVFLVPDLFAQDAEEPEPTGQKATAISYITNAGIWMVPLGLCSMAMIALVVYNFMQLTQAKFAPVELKMALLDHMQNCRVRSAIEVSSTSPTYLGRMSAVSLPHVDATEPDTLGREAVEDAMAEFTIRENAGHMTWISYLGLLGQIAPMLGLLGTVVGMLGAFSTLSVQASADPSQLAGDIGVAMVTTASGLIIAIPSVFFFFFFKNRLNKLVSDSHLCESDMLDASIAAVNADQQMAKVPEGLAG